MRWRLYIWMLALVSFGVLAWTTARARSGHREPGMVGGVGFTGTPGYHLAAWGIALTVLAAPIDDLWHRLFGLDVTLFVGLGIVLARLPAFAQSLPSGLETAVAAVLTARASLASGALARRTGREL